MKIWILEECVDYVRTGPDNRGVISLHFTEAAALAARDEIHAKYRDCPGALYGVTYEVYSREVSETIEF